MRQKLGTFIEEKVMRLAKRRAAEEGRPLYEIIEEALTHYLQGTAASPHERETAYHMFCERPLKLSRAQFRHILEEDCWD